MVHIRRAVPHDAAHLAVLKGTGGWSLERLSALCDGEGVNCVLLADMADVQGQRGIAGFVALSCVLDEGEIEHIVVREPCRRQNIGGRLLHSALSALAGAGATRCHLEVRASNVPAHSLYASAGFTACGVRRNYYPSPGGREDAVRMALNLRDYLPT